MTINFEKELAGYKKILILSPHIKEDLRILYNYHSNKIEGNSLTLGETRTVLIDHLGVIKPLKDISEMQAHDRALDYVINTLVKNKESVSLRNIREIQSLIEPNKSGFRNVNVEIKGVNTKVKEPYEIIASLEQLIDDYKKNNEDLITKVAIFHAEFEKIHPFEDGNGRTGRLLMNLELMKKNYPLTAITIESRPSYYEALELAQVKKDYSLIIKVVKNGIEKTFKYIQDKTIHKGIEI